MVTLNPAVGVLELHWHTDEQGTVVYSLYDRGSCGSLTFLGAFEQGPFETNVQVAQWAWRSIAKRVPLSVYSRR